MAQMKVFHRIWFYATRVIPTWFLRYLCYFAFYLVSCHNTNLEIITKVTSVIDVDKRRLVVDGPEILCIPPPYPKEFTPKFYGRTVLLLNVAVIKWLNSRPLFFGEFKRLHEGLFKSISQFQCRSSFKFLYSVELPSKRYYSVYTITFVYYSNGWNQAFSFVNERQRMTCHFLCDDFVSLFWKAGLL